MVLQDKAITFFILRNEDSIISETFLLGFKNRQVWLKSFGSY
jgi:hypothetical protein